MCIIVAKKKGVKMPETDILQTCFTNNPDGAGVMWNENGAVNIRKGFMTWESFKAFISELSNRIDLTKHGIVMHFRITTHGETTKQNCHPFPVSSKIRDVRKTEVLSDLGVAHNGIIPIKCIHGLSDTQTYIVRHLSKYRKAHRAFYRDMSIMNHIQTEIASKMAFLASDGRIYTIGDFNEDIGVLYSNCSYQVSKYCSYYDLWDNWNPHGYSTTEKELAPIYGYIVDESGEFIDCDSYEYYIDKDLCVYEYDYFADAVLKMQNAVAFNYSGLLYKFNRDEAYPMEVESING